MKHILYLAIIVSGLTSCAGSGERTATGFSQEEVLFSKKFIIINDSIASRKWGDELIIYKKGISNAKEIRYYPVQ
jgi:hypothetical protein